MKLNKIGKISLNRFEDSGTIAKLIDIEKLGRYLREH